MPRPLTLAEQWDEDALTSATDLSDPDLDERGKPIAAPEQASYEQAKAARLLGMTPRRIGLTASGF